VDPEPGVAAPRRRGARLVAGVVALALVVVLAAGLVVSRRSTPDPVCAGLGGGVAGLREIAWSNGFTRAGPSWVAALTDGVEHGDAPTRQAIAATVAADQSGYATMVESLGSDDRASFDRLRAAALDPASTPDPTDVHAVRTIAGMRCNLV
jgi:hypothetical protein